MLLSINSEAASCGEHFSALVRVWLGSAAVNADPKLVMQGGCSFITCMFFHYLLYPHSSLSQDQNP